MITCFHKFYTLQDFIEQKDNLNKEYFMVSTGISDLDFEKVKEICNNIDVKWLCVDIANGYGLKFLEFESRLVQNFLIKLLLLEMWQLQIW